MTPTDTSTASTETSRLSFAPWAAYVVPIAVFLILTQLEAHAPKAYVWLYLLKVAVVTGLLLAFRAPWRDIRPSARVVFPAILVGLVVFAEWILLDRWLPYPHIGGRAGIDPFAAIPDPAMRVLFLAVRLFGLVAMVPVMEELFWRSFLIRWLTRPDFLTVQPGAFSWSAFWMVAAAFGMAHPEWLAAVICAACYGLLLRATRSLFACVVSHAVSNLALGVYILLTGNWSYW